MYKEFTSLVKQTLMHVILHFFASAQLSQALPEMFMQFLRFSPRRLHTMVVLTMSLFITPPVFARTAQDVAKSVFGMFGSFADVIMGVIFLAGLALGGYSLILLRNHTEVPKEWPRLRRPFVCLFAAAGMVGYPSYIALSANTINGDGAQKNSLSAGVYARIGD